MNKEEGDVCVCVLGLFSHCHESVSAAWPSGPELSSWSRVVVFSTSGQPLVSAGVWLHVCVWFGVALSRDKNS